MATKQTKAQIAAKAQDARRRAIFNTCSEEYEAVLEYQNGACYITQEKPKPGQSLHIDHRHKDGLVRGLLSPWVNKGLAYFRDNPEWLRRAADYLENPPYSIALGESVYGVIGKSTKKAKNRKFGPDGSKTPQPRVFKTKKDVTN